MKIEDFDWIVVSTTQDIGKARVEKLLPRLATEGIVPTVLWFEPKEYFTEEELSAFRTRWGMRFIERYEYGIPDEEMSGIHAGDSGCGISSATASLSTNSPVIVLENDFVPVKFLKQRLQEEVLDYLPEDWAVCSAASRPWCLNTEYGINEFITYRTDWIFAHIVLWRNTEQSKIIANKVLNGEVYCYSGGWERGMSLLAAAQNLPVYSTRLWYGGQDEGKSETQAKHGWQELLFDNGWSDFKDGIEIEHNGRVSVYSLEIPVCGGCNLRCKNCSHFAPFVDWTVPTEDLLKAISQVIERIRPHILRIIGGEPLLHPDLPIILDAVSSMLAPQTNVIDLCTNGVGLVEHAEAILRIHEKDSRFRITVSEHVPVLETMSWLKENNIRHSVHAGEFIEIPVELQTSNKYHAYHYSDPQKTCVAGHCYTLFDNKLYRCSIHARRAVLAKYGTVNGAVTNAYADTVLQWNGFDYLNASAMQIRNYLMDSPYDECTLCSAAPVRVLQTQITQEEYSDCMRYLTGKDTADNVLLR